MGLSGLGSVFAGYSNDVVILVHEIPCVFTTLIMHPTWSLGGQISL